MNEDMMTEAERALIAADGTDGLLGERGKGVFHIHTLGLQLQESLIIGLVAVQLPVIQLHDAVGDAVQKIPVMGDHKQRALKPL